MTYRQKGRFQQLEAWGVAFTCLTGLLLHFSYRLSGGAVWSIFVRRRQRQRLGNRQDHGLALSLLVDRGALLSQAAFEKFCGRPCNRALCDDRGNHRVPASLRRNPRDQLRMGGYPRLCGVRGSRFLGLLQGDGGGLK